MGEDIKFMGSFFKEEQQTIVDKHNELRRRVAKGEETLGVNNQPQPKATNMNKLSWDDDLAKVAQVLVKQ